jgi:hypothetical protein
MYSKVVQYTIDEFISHLIPNNVAMLRNLGKEDRGIQYEYTITVEKVYQDEKYTSVILHFSSYTGGANGTYSRLGIVLDTQTGKRIYIEDIFSAKKLVYRLSPVWQKSIQKYIYTKKGVGLTHDEKTWIKDGTTDIQNYQWFSLTDKELIIYGQQYQHAAYFYGTFDLKYPLALLRKVKK